jgi:hypothetical protein
MVREFYEYLIETGCILKKIFDYVNSVEPYPYLLHLDLVADKEREETNRSQ